MSAAAQQAGSATGLLLALDGTVGEDREVLGGKAASIERMRRLGVAVPPAFVLTTEVCRRYYAEGEQLPGEVWRAVPDAVAELERITGRSYGTGPSPLLLSVRSGAAASMPGMMDTILNLGMTDEVRRALATETGDASYAEDTARRFTEQFQHVTGHPAPEDPWDQLRLAALAVLRSWRSTRAVAYRADRGIESQGGTAVTVQAMVFGNLDEASGTGVLFTRNPLTGSAEPYGEWLTRGQGEDVVSGKANAEGLDAFAAALPDAYQELMAAARRLEHDARDVQDIEFTVESGKLWLLQTRAAKRTAEARIRHAVQLRKDGLLDAAEALDRVSAEDVAEVLRPHLDRSAMAGAATLATGKPACPGIGTGVVATESDEAEDRVAEGERVVLARPTTDPDDVAAMASAAAVITELGGSTSHAAVASRELGVPCVVGCGPGTVSTLAGQTVTVDAAGGAVYAGELRRSGADVHDDPDLALLEKWARAEPGADPDADLPMLLSVRADRRGS